MHPPGRRRRDPKKSAFGDVYSDPSGMFLLPNRLDHVRPSSETRRDESTEEDGRAHTPNSASRAIIRRPYSAAQNEIITRYETDSSNLNTQQPLDTSLDDRSPATEFNTPQPATGLSTSQPATEFSTPQQAEPKQKDHRPTRHGRRWRRDQNRDFIPNDDSDRDDFSDALIQSNFNRSPRNTSPEGPKNNSKKKNESMSRKEALAQLDKDLDDYRKQSVAAPQSKVTIAPMLPGQMLPEHAPMPNPQSVEDFWDNVEDGQAQLTDDSISNERPTKKARCVSKRVTCKYTSISRNFCKFQFEILPETYRYRYPIARLYSKIQLANLSCRNNSTNKIPNSEVEGPLLEATLNWQTNTTTIPRATRRSRSQTQRSGNVDRPNQGRIESRHIPGSTQEESSDDEILDVLSMRYVNANNIFNINMNKFLAFHFSRSESC